MLTIALGLAAVVLFLAAPARADETLLRAEAGDRVRLHLHDGTMLDGRMIGTSAERLFVNDTRTTPREVPRTDVVRVEVLRQQPSPRGSLPLALGLTALTAGLGYAIASGSDDSGDLSAPVSGSSAFGAAIMLIGAPTVGVLTYRATRPAERWTWEPAVLAEDVLQRREQLRLVLARERRDAAPARPVGLAIARPF